MNDELDKELEQELGRCQPAQPSQRLEQAIAEQLDGPAAWNGIRRTVLALIGSVGGLAAAACLLIAFWTRPQPHPRDPECQTQEPWADGVKRIEALPPTPWGYDKAMQHSQLSLFLEHNANVLLPDVAKHGS